MTGQSLYDNFLSCRRMMTARFNQEELESLCLSMGTNAEDLPHQTKDRLATELLQWADRRDQRSGLLTLLRQERPTVAWPTDYTTKTVGELSGPSFSTLVPNYHILVTNSPNSSVAEGKSIANVQKASLSIADRQRIVTLILDSNSVPPSPAARASFMHVAGLGFMTNDFPLAEATSRAFVDTLITRAESYGPLDISTGLHALGALLEYVASLDATPIDVRGELRDLCKKYNLIAPLSTGATEVGRVDTVTITPRHRRIALMRLRTLGEIEVDNFAYCFSVELKGEISPDRKVRLLLVEIEKLGGFWELYQFLDESFSREVRTEVNDWTSGDSVSVNKVVSRNALASSSLVSSIE